MGRSPRHHAHGGAAVSLLDVWDVPSRRLDGFGWSSFATRFRGEGTAARRTWRVAYVRRTIVADVLCAAVAAIVGYLVRFESTDTTVPAPSLWAVLLLPLIWVAVMLVAR